MNVKPLILLLIVAVLYLAAVNDHWSPKPDSGLYMGLGRSLAEGRGMVFNGREQWGIPPVTPFLIAACRYVAGPHVWLTNLCMTLMGLGVVVFAWRSVRLLSADLPAWARRSVEVGTLLAVGLSARLFLDSTRVLTDVPCLFFLMLAFWAVLRARSGSMAWYAVGAVAAALAVLTRVPALVPAAGLLAAAVIDIARQRRGRAVAGLAVGAALAAALVAWWAVAIRSRASADAIDYLDTGYVSRFNLAEEGKWGEIAVALGLLPEAALSSIVYQKTMVLGLPLLGLVAVGLWLTARLRQWVVVLPVALYTAFLIVFSPTTVASRYLLLVMPMLVYLMLVGAVAAADPVRRWLARAAHRLRRGGTGGLARRIVAGGVRAGRWLALRAVPVTVGLGVAISAPKIAREIYWMRHPAFYEVFSHGEWAPYRRLAEHLRTHADLSHNTCLAPECTVVHYWSGVRCDSLFVWEGKEIVHFDGLSPEEFARAAAARGDRFVVVRVDDDPDGASWGWRTVAAMEATGAFIGPPTHFGPLALFERTRGPSAEVCSPAGPVAAGSG